MTVPSEETIAILRVELEDIEPLIWRGIAVRTSMDLKTVHRVIQAAIASVRLRLGFRTRE